MQVAVTNAEQMGQREAAVGPADRDMFFDATRAHIEKVERERSRNTEELAASLQSARDEANQAKKLKEAAVSRAKILVRLLSFFCIFEGG